MAVLDLVYSGPGTGKTSHCIEVFKRKILESKSGIESRSFFILPSREHAERVQNLILKQGVPGLFNAHILTIHDFASTLDSSPGISVVSDTLRKRALGEILQEKECPLPSFERVRDFTGFSELLVDTIKEFKSGFLGIAEFEKRSHRLLKDAVFRSKFTDFSVLMKRYEASLRKMRIEEPEDAMARLIKQPAPRRKVELVIFDGFYHFTRAQRKFIGYLSRVSERILVTLTLPENSEKRAQVFDYPIRTRQALLEAGFKRFRRAPAENRRTRDKALRHLEENLFLEAPRVFAGSPGALCLMEARSPRGEVEMIAREIKKIYRQSQVHYSDICVILRKVGVYKRLVASVFSEFGIPVVVHEREKLIEHGFVATLWRFLNLMDEDWKREDLFYLLKSSYFAPALPLRAVLRLEAAAFQKNITSGRAQWEELVSSDVDPQVRRAFEKLSAMEKGFLGAAGAGLFVDRVFSWINEFKSPASAAAPDPADEDMLSALSDILENARRFYQRSSERLFSSASFVKELKDSLKSALFSLRPVSKNRVQVYDVVMALPKEYKVVFVAGLLEKVFPQGVVEDPLFKDAERRVINARDTVLEERSRRVTGERFFFYMAVARARERLYLSHPKYGLEGKPSLASFFIEEVKKCFEKIREVKKDIGDLVPEWREWETPREVMQGLSESLFQTRSSSLPEPVLQALNDSLAERQFREVLRLGFSDGEARIQDPRIRKIFSGTEGPFSPTRLETFATCAFKYFAGRVLRLREPMEGREFLEMGNVLHKVLEGFYREAPEAERASGRLWSDDSGALKALHERLDREIRRSPFSYLPLYRQKIYETNMKQILLLFVREEKALFEERGLVPTYFEHEFRDLKVRDGGEEFLIEGKIDRIDVDPGSRQALVTDYKRSRRSVTIQKKLAKGLELQLPLYLLAARRLLGLEIIGGELRFLTSASSEGLYYESARAKLGLHHSRKTYSADEFENMLSQTEARVGQAVRRLRGADISVKSKSCQYCSFSPVCRFEPWRLVYSENE